MILQGLLPNRDATIALAGVMQALYAVHQLSAKGKTDKAAVRVSVHSVLCTDPPDVVSVYGGLPSISDGIRCLVQVLVGRGTEPLEPMEQALMTRYAGQVLRLGGLVRNNATLSQRLGDALATVPSLSVDEPDEEDDVFRQQVNALAKAYIAHISPLKPRVMVSGQPTYLRNEQFVAEIRCQLLAAVRSAVLWHQCGGRLWQLLFFRGLVLKQARDLAASLPNPTSHPTD